MKPEDRKRLKQHIEMIVEHKIPSNVVFCPNCEKDTECIHTAELYECKECGEDFAKYIVSRKPANSDVSATQNVTTPEPPEDALHARIAELEAENTELKERIAMLDVTAVFKSLGEMEHIEKVANLKAELDRAAARIAELEAERRWIPVSERLPEERQNVLALDRTGTAYHWEYSRSLSNIFVSYYTNWMPLPELPIVTVRSVNNV